MKYLVLIACVVLAVASAAPASPAQLLKYDNEPYDNERGSYSFGFQQDDGTRHQQKGEIRNQGLENEYLAVVGEYSWVGPNNVQYIVKYVADDNGYNSELEEGPPGAPLEITNALLS